jgi:nitrate reductase gamma subunit
MYQLVTGPLAWVSFGIFFLGLILRMVLYISGFKVPVADNFTERIKRAILVIFYWLFPFGSKSFRKNPGFTISVFIYHIGLIVTPVFLLSHNIILKQKWGIRFWTLPEATSDVLTIAVIISIILVLFRRIALPEAKSNNSPFDYILLVIIAAVFITGFLAYHQFSNYQFWLITHIISAEIMLVAIPFCPGSRLKTPNEF